jgi:hypothetical protein
MDKRVLTFFMKKQRQGDGVHHQTVPAVPVALDSRSTVTVSTDPPCRVDLTKVIHLEMHLTFAHHQQQPHTHTNT